MEGGGRKDWREEGRFGKWKRGWVGGKNLSSTCTSENVTKSPDS